MITWAQYKISSYCSCVWCESRESGGRGSSSFPCVNSVVETYSYRVTFRNLSNINDVASLWKQAMGLTRWLFPQKSSTADLRLDSKCGSDSGWCKVRGWEDCKSVELIAAGWCTRKWLKFNQTIRNLTSGDLANPLVAIQLVLIRLKKTQSCIS